jgi:TolB protein
VGSVAALSLAVLASASYARSDGAERIPISGLSGSLQNPCFSPDSSQIALTLWPRRYNEGQASVHVADVESGEVLSRVSPEGTAVNLPGSCWNPVTDLILFSLESDAPDWPYSANPDGSGLRRLVSLPGKIAIEPSFSPDGERIVFEVSKYDAEGNGSIYVAKVDGTGIRRLTRGHDDRQPNWSPKGDRIVFQRRRGEVWDVWTIRPSGRGIRNVTKTRRISETDIAWAPDGDRLVFSTDAYEGQIAALAVRSVSGGATRRLTRARRWYDGAPSWSPDGSAIAFEARIGDPDGSRGTRLYRIDAPAP